MSPVARLIALPLAVVALGGGLAACGGSDTHSGHSSSEAAQGTPAAAAHDGHDAAAPGEAAHAHAGSGSSDAASTSPGKPSADPAAVDAAFTRQMIPHHQMAVAMSKAILEETKRPEIKRLAAAIRDAQEPEIAELTRIAKSEGLSIDGASDATEADARTLGLSVDGMGMGMDHSATDPDENVDRAFLDHMAVHHIGAVEMAKVQLAHGRSAELHALARTIITAQEREVAEMKALRTKWFGSGKTAR